MLRCDSVERGPRVFRRRKKVVLSSMLTTHCAWPLVVCLPDMKPSMHCSGHMCVHLLETSVFVHHAWLLPDNTVSSWSGFQHFVPLPLPAFSSLSQRSHARSSPSPALPNFRVKRIGTTGCYPAAMLTINSARVSLAVRIESSTHQVR